ncbi:MAG: bifunctional hydroxymethylpyrimidine kinase/phosphomethylpyrimidine kinase, partial [Lachnospiraceae bacterium]|nr:bifunctional hydroxymethylpyrimidine kinase/phosphomethylpyrimidine kinase [Lachnospiraceae bacterium]
FMNSYAAEIARCRIVVISGSIPRGVPVTIYADLIRIAKSMKKKVLLDTSGDALKKAVAAKPYMIKPNLKELEILMDRKIHGMQAVTLATAQLIQQGIPNILVSMGSKGILYARASKRSKDGMNLYYVQAPHVQVVNTVGSGDCAVAAFAMAILEKLKPEEICRKCVAISSANTLTIENGVIDVAKADEFYRKLELSVPMY